MAATVGTRFAAPIDDMAANAEVFPAEEDATTHRDHSGPLFVYGDLVSRHLLDRRRASLR